MSKPVWILLAALALPQVGGCVIGAPPGFSSGDRWTFPLAAPLEDGLLLVPVKINGKGPYLFQIDPDSEVTSVDQAIFQEANLYKAQAERIIDERDVRVVVQHAEVRTIEVGDLKVSNKTVRVHAIDTYSFNGRRVRGLLGRDVIADSLILTIDRDRGIGQLAVQGKQAPPDDAYALGYDPKANLDLAGQLSRRLVSARINDAFNVTMHLDLGSPVSLLRDKIIAAKKMPRLAVNATFADEVGTQRTSNAGTIAATVAVGKINAAGLLLLPYVDKRWRETDLDGVLGVDFFAPYTVMVNWHKNAFYLAPRPTAFDGALRSARLGRWGKSITECDELACVKVEVQGGTPPPAEAAPSETPAVETPPAAPPAEAAPAPAPGEPAAGSGGAPVANEVVPVAPAAGSAPAVAPAQPPAAFRPREPLVLLVSRSDGAPTRSFEVLLEAIDEAGKPRGLPHILVTLPEGATQVMDELPADYDRAGYRVLDISPFARECPASGLGCVWRLPQRR